MGFAGDKHRLNVALTRAKCHLLLVGSMPVLQSGSEAFKLLLAKCRSLPGGYRQALLLCSSCPQHS